jgi:hypothetical protein
MGWSLAWLGFKDSSKSEVLKRLGLRVTGRREDLGRSNIGYAELQSGWRLVLYDHKEFGERELSSLSANCELLYVFVEEHVMFSKVAFWRSASEIWSVEHAGEDGGRNLKIKGNVPATLAAIREKRESEQDHEDQTPEKHRADFIFDVPVALAESLVGFRYDKDIPGVWDDTVEILEPALPAQVSTSLLKRLFRRS